MYRPLGRSAARDMAPLLRPQPFLHPLLLLLLLRLRLTVSAAELEMSVDAPALRCSEGLTHCHITSASHLSAVLPEPNDAVDVTHMQLNVLLCCPHTHDCEPCLRVNITVKATEEVSEESGQHIDEEKLLSMKWKTEGSGQTERLQSTAVVTVCLSSPGRREIWKTIEFQLSHSASVQSSEQSTHQLLLTELVMFDSPVVVHVYARSEETRNIQNITIPSLQEVCAMSLENTVRECDTPRLRAETDPENSLVLLHLENPRQDDVMYQMNVNGIPGNILTWPKGKREMAISSNLVTPCLCFQVWWRGKDLRSEYCPFKHQQDALVRMQHNVSVSVEEIQLRQGGTGLSWNVSAPCRLEAEVWLCKKDVTGSGRCEEVTGSRQQVHNHHGWRATRTRHWKTGEFNVSSHPLLCVQIKIQGMESHSEPQCPFSTSRWRWSLPLLIGLLLICVTILGAYFIQGLLKGYVWRWLKEDDVKGAVGGGHVVLLYPPDDTQALPGLMCHLGSSLQALGFSVSLDLWSGAELSVLGPVPWLHSRLDRLKRQGGKVVLALTQATWLKADEWGAQKWNRTRCMEEEEEEEEEEGGAGRRPPTASHCVDVFSASLSCILADYLQGRAGERFLLVQFESHPLETGAGGWTLPELFRGLHVYSLPSQSLGFLTELAGARQAPTASARRKRAGGLRVAARALARRLAGFTGGTTILRFAGTGPEMMPLQPCLITPPSSPDTDPKVSEVEWV